MTVTQALLDERDIVAVCVRFATALDNKDNGDEARAECYLQV